MTHKTKGKFQRKLEGPFVVESVYSNGAYRLITSNGDTLMIQSTADSWRNTILNSTFPLIKLILHLWSKFHPDQSDGLGFEIQDAWESAKEKLSHSTDHIMVDWSRVDWTLLMHDWRNDKAKNSDFSLVTLLMIRLTLHFWSKIHPDQSNKFGFKIQNA